jgi:hypothetical protein
MFDPHDPDDAKERAKGWNGETVSEVDLVGIESEEEVLHDLPCERLGEPTAALDAALRG